MNILIIADDDSAVSQMPEIKVDVLISCGDLTDETIVKAAQRCSCRHVLAVKGNHDSAAPFPAPIVDLHLNTWSFQGIVFGGFCGSWKYKPRGHHLYEQSEVELALRHFPKVDVFVAHNSPSQVHDKDDFVHLGFAAFNSYIANHHPRFFFHGHQHVSCESVVGSTRVVGSFGYRTMVLPA
jgi:Icc-related predicted phosphoesterase